MLVDFTVENFRSIREPVTLSMIEQAPRKTRQKGTARKRPVPTDEEISPAMEVPGWPFKLLRTAGIFGANASGKSNVVRAYMALGNLLKYATPEVMALARTPFGLQHGSGPTRFHARHLCGGLAYDYDLAIDRDGVVEETLETCDAAGKTNVLFDRERLQEGGLVRWATARGLGSVKALAEATGAATPFLHLLVWKLEVGEVAPLAADWKAAVGVPGSGGKAMEEVTSQKLAQDSEMARRVAELMREFDIGISSILVVPFEVDGRTRHQVSAGHTFADESEVLLPLHEESMGTRSLYALAGSILAALGRGSLLCIDEFGAHLHPYITRRIVELFQSPETNPKGAQLLFNSQDVTLLSDHLLRRDQVWYTSKGKDGATDLFPLSDFKVRNDLAIDQAYLDGRFGAVPFLSTPRGL